MTTREKLHRMSKMLTNIKKKNLNTLPKLANHTIKYEAEYYL